MTIPAPFETPFASFLMAGYECSTHIGLRRGRHDVIAQTRHDEHALEDYRLLADFGIRTVREGVRWDQVERLEGQYDFSSLRPMIEAARATDVQVIWDLFHFGWPDDLDVFSAAFVDRFVNLARTVTRIITEELPGAPMIVPVNEISFLSFAAGEAGFFHPFARGRGDELKRQLARAAIEASAAVLEVAPNARLVHPDPVIHVIAPRHQPELAREAEAYRRAQFAAWDMISGRLEPELGGRHEFLDILGLNYYPHNQWELGGPRLTLDDPRWKPFSRIALEVFERYQRPMIVAETGAEGAFRAPWLRHMTFELWHALRLGVPLRGLCLYPILDHPGWDDDRHVRCGLWGFRRRGERKLDEDYGLEVRRLAQLENVLISVGASRKPPSQTVAK